MLDKSCVVCTTVRNCASYLPIIFENILRLSTLFETFAVIISYDNCTDKSEQLIYDFRARVGDYGGMDRDYDHRPFPVHIIHNKENNHPHRTFRIANARNSCISLLYAAYPNSNYHIMLDADNVNAHPYNLDIIRSHIERSAEWDCVSFFNNHYYDIWALLYDDIAHHCWGYNNSQQVVHAMACEIVRRLTAACKDGNAYFACASAFNGFAIYNTAAFKGVLYNGDVRAFMDLFTDEDRERTVAYFRDRLPAAGLSIVQSIFTGQACEHLYYHINATRRNGARIRISADSIFM